MPLLDGIPLRTLTKRKGPYSFSCMGPIRLRGGRRGTLSPWTPCDFFVKKSTKNSTTPAGGTRETVQLCGVGIYGIICNGQGQASCLFLYFFVCDLEQMVMQFKTHNIVPYKPP